MSADARRNPDHDVRCPAQLAGSYPLSRLREAQYDFKDKRFVGKLVIVSDSKVRDCRVADRVMSDAVLNAIRDPRFYATAPSPSVVLSS